MIKRSFDFVVSLVFLTLALPVFAVIALLVKISSEGPVFFRHRRVGLGEKPFDILKFRTMYVHDGKSSLQITAGKDSRITPIGKILRKYKLDELPQLINVLKGDMSLVGPRPEVAKYISFYTPEARKEIFRVRPGITDLASIAFRHEEDLLSEQSDPEHYYINIILPSKCAMQVEYVSKSGFLFDLKLIFKTLLRVVFA